MLKCLLWLSLAFLACGQKAVNAENTSPESENLENVALPEMKTGAENYELYLPQLKDKRVGFVVNQSSKVGEQHLLDFMLEKGIQVSKIFALEHGIRGLVADGGKVSDGIDSLTGAPIVSLYGKSRKPSPEDLSDLDVIVFDIQDVGVRFYTYISSLQLVLEAGAENGKKVLVFDRPNPHAHYVSGPMLEENWKSFVGAFHIPVVYGMTIGELAQMMVGEKWLNATEKLDYEVIRCTDYDRNKLYPLSAWPSPNLPNMRSVLLYPSLCFFEGTDVSVGRGTNTQFQVFGHPAFKGQYDFTFTPSPNVGSTSPPQNGKACFGRDLSSLEPDSLFALQKLDYSYLVEAYQACKNAGVDLVTKSSHFDRLAGTERLKLAVESGKTVEEIEVMFKNEEEAFKVLRAKYLIY